MQAVAFWQVVGNSRQHKQRGVNIAHRPEVIDERRLRNMLKVVVNNVLPRLLAMEKVFLAQAPALADHSSDVA